ncbi:DNA polymerase III subunit gamma and tau [Pseudoclavibacter sp. CFCC 11306]|uniref:DNA polymerase III subunit gamma and tau n=1 Tax=Pseudoclavibacter sp. CFCC 11306 TaxID=1564493 RepID=UPI00130171D2|nr:DNA polymerase III subunit gamma and tau [Pseudoclavibacter sp. CFCC 11306]KAB1659101.1 DNA polymerase III subunit gamma and tau [Pseudoclavibacter sp. CFCC 11306]
MVTALYRRYRPDTFADLIGQEQVTTPLSTALRTNRVNHAYLFSGPRGCGKTTSARILARCLNCEQGPTDTPCGECASCRELATGGSGSLDVIEIDAASHGGVDDARDLRERAVFAPARDRYKVFIIDEAHMVTAAGFNALLKLVEEPPEHVKFIFATTEPEKVIGTIRSRTHHYPFRLVPPATMLPFLEKILSAEDVSAEPGVLPLAVRAGGGSVRDTLSVVDQLIAGSETGTISYARTIGLLGYTPGDLLAEVIDAIGRQQAEQLFLSVDKVVQTGQDPKRFAEDVLERLRDLIVVQAAPDQAQAILRGTSQDELDVLQRQAREFGTAELSRAADIVNHTLNTMAGTTSPRMQLELMCARLLVPAADANELGALSRIDRLERRIGVQSTATNGAPINHGAAPQASSPEHAAPPTAQPEQTPPQPAVQPKAQPAAQQPAPAPAPAPSHSTEQQRESAQRPIAQGESPASRTSAPAESPAPSTLQTPAADGAASASRESTADQQQPSPPATALTLDQIRAGWDQVLAHLEGTNRRAWIVAINAKPVAFHDDILTLSFASSTDAESFRGSRTGSNPAADGVRDALQQIFGIRMRFIAHSGSTRPAPQVTGSPVPRDAGAPASAPAEPTSTTTGDSAASRSTATSSSQSAAAESSASLTSNPPQPATPAADAPWPEELPPEPPEDEYDAPAPDDLGPERQRAVEPATPPSAPAQQPTTPHHRAQYGEAVIRQMLHAKPIDER